MKKSDKIMILLFMFVIVAIFVTAGITIYNYYQSQNEELPRMSDKNTVDYSDEYITQAIEAGKNNNFTKAFVLPKISEGQNKDVNMVIIGTPYYKIALQAYIDANKYGYETTVDQIRARFDELEIDSTIFFSAKFNEPNSDSRIVLIQNDDRVEGEELESESKGIILKKYKLEDIDFSKSAIIRVQDKYNESIYDEYKVDFTRYY